MNLAPSSLKLSLLPLAALAMGIPSTLRAQVNGTWNLAGGGAWGTAANWSGGVPAGAGATATITTQNITAARTITLDANRTIGNLVVGDATTPSHDTSITAGATAASVLTLSVSGGPGVIAVQNRNLTINTPVAGTGGLTVTNGGVTPATLPPTALGVGGGVVILSGSNTFTGGLNIRGAGVQLNNNNAANSGNNLNTITLSTAENGTGASRLLIGGGITNNSAITINSTTGIVGLGVLQQTGTGAGTFTGRISILGAPTAGGHFAGGGASTNPLVLNGFIDAVNPNSLAVQNLTQRDGFVRYGGGGNYTSLMVTNNAWVNATDGISTEAIVTLGGSGNATLDLNGFDQTLSGITLGNGANVGTVNVGTRTLTLNGDLTATGSAMHSIIGSGTGNINSGASARFLTVNDNLGAEELFINGASLNGSGGFVKTGQGTLAMNTTVNSSLSVEAGALSIGRVGVPGTLTSNALNFQDGTVLNVDLSSSGDVANIGTLTTNGITTVNVNQLGGLLAPGDYPILNYTGTSPGLAGFSLTTPIGHSASSLVDTGSAIVMRVTANNRLFWSGAASNDWNIANALNFYTLNGLTETPSTFLQGDDLLFPPVSISPVVNLQEPVRPSLVTFDHAAPVQYEVSGTGSIDGSASLVKNGTGRTIITLNNAYIGSTTINGGTLELDHDSTSNTVLSATSGVSIAPTATLALTRDDGPITFTRNITGSGTVVVNPHSSILGSDPHGVTLTGNNAGFSGSLQLLSPLSGTYRITSATPAQLGSSTIIVNDGAQLYTANGLTYPNAITLTGKGFADTGGLIGALRLENNSIWSGPITITDAGARIGAHNSTATISGSITGGDLNVNGSDGSFNNAYTLIFTGNNSYGKTTIGGGSTTTAGVSTRRLNIGNGGTSGTLGTGPVEIVGDGQNGLLAFDLSDGYTLAAGQTISAEASTTTPNRVFLEADVLGTGLNQNGQAITFGTAAPGQGGNIRVSQARAGAIFNTNGPITTETIRVSSGQTGGVMNINSGSVINSNTLFGGEAANMSGTVNQAAGTTVNVTGQVRLGHFATETSVYNMNGGALTLTGDSPFNSPSTAAAGGANATGDNNIDAGATAIITGGGIYLGIDGTGLFNHNAGTVTTNWIVLDNRANNGAGTNMPTGVDEYNLNGGILNLRSNWGIIQRNTSAALNLGGGTIRIDNTGTGNGTGAALAMPLDAEINVTGPVTLDTNGTDNSFNINRNLLGSGALTYTGGGILRLNPTGIQSITASLAGSSPLQKENTGTALITGSMAAYSGAVTVNAGRLDLPASAAPPTVTVATGASIGGEFNTPSLSLDGSNVFFDPTTPAALTGTALQVNGTVTLDFTKPVADGVYVALKYTSRSGSGTFIVNNSSSYRSVTVSEVAGEVRVTVASTKTLTWDGTGATTWDLITSSNWKNAGNTADQFFLGDSVLFNDLTSQTTVAISSGVSPAGTRVNSFANNYTFNSTGTGLSGTGGLIKEGTSTLTLNGVNTYSGVTDIRGGVLLFTNPASLGNGAPGNSIALSGSSRLIYGGATALDFGLHRNLAIGTGGGSISHNNATAAALTLPGRLSGSEPLTLNSTAAGGGTFILSGNNSSYTGAVSLAATSTGLTTLRLATPASVPAGGSITVNFPAAGATGNANSLELGPITLPAGLTLKFTSGAGGTPSLRSQLTNTSGGDAIVNGPITLAGSNIIQFSIPAGSITLNGPVTAPEGFNGTLFLRGAGGTGFVNSTIDIPGAILSKTDGNTWVINTTGNNWATTSIVVGGIRLGIADALCPTAPLSLGQNDANAVTLNLNGFNQTVAGLTTSPIVVNANTTGKAITSATPATFTVNQSNNTTYAGLFTGAASLVKNGSGTLTLLGASTTTGTTRINEGILLVNNATGSATGTGNVTVAATATLGGTGSFTGALTLENGGILSPGSGAGNLSTGPATLAGGSTYDWDVANWTGAAGVGYDRVTATSLALTATPATPLVIRISSSVLSNFTDTSASFTLFSTTGGITGFNPAAVQIDSSGFTGGGTGVFSVALSGNNLVLNYTVPGGNGAYNTWAASEGLTGPDTALTADPDKDGMTNLAEFALNSKPLVGADSGKVRFALSTISGQTYLTYTLPVRTGVAFTGTTELSGTFDSVTYRIQGDTGLSAWTGDVDDVTPALSAGLPALDSGWTYRTFRNATAVSAGTRQFLRAKFESVP